MAEYRERGGERGIVTIAFMLVLIIVMFFMLYFFKLCLALTHVSIVQYISYSTARKLYLGGESQSIQTDMAKEDYKKLRNEKFFKQAIYTDSSPNATDWFYLAPDLESAGSKIGFNNNIIDTSKYRQMFYGVGIAFFPHIFDFSIPFLTDPSSPSSDTAFPISSYLGREPSQAECEDFFKLERKDKILVDFSGLASIDNPPVLKNIKGDNGC